MSKPTILLIDDEIFPDSSEGAREYMWYYSEAMREAGMEVLEASDPDEALRVLKERGDTISVVVLDVMLPPGEALKHVDTNEGLKTGIPLASLIAKNKEQLPIVVLTNVANPKIMASLKSIRSVMGILAKEECTPFKLVEYLNGITGE